MSKPVFYWLSREVHETLDQWEQLKYFTYSKGKNVVLGSVDRQVLMWVAFL